MIWNLSIVLAVVIILIIVARRLPDARDKLSEAKEVSDKDLSLYGLIAQADDAFESKEYEKAEDLYVKAATQDPDNPKIYSRLGVIFLEQGNYYDAKDAFFQAVKLEPDLASRHINLGIALTGLKDYFKAQQSFKKALSLDPKNKKYQKLLEKVEKGLDREKKRR
ncbi:MAG: TPR Domain containing protein [Berkelbacteria bacterium GW2011_GWB1_38_5]|uniref:TPR Domain containing protein n=2 Tax=Candidatus Berkelbacteria TaxID=1618330 RepID=A0A0G0LGP2_9BACT|nr:MAG: TPR Domain containing protein [Berkelbacteria bacterium GW2011_GWB1_38_5]KKQ91068.1 MAG: TPR Domain containing protein [Berkelbacteria bacterium GW2011_GWA1_39_10]